VLYIPVSSFGFVFCVLSSCFEFWVNVVGRVILFCGLC